MIAYLLGKTCKRGVGCDNILELLCKGAKLPEVILYAIISLTAGVFFLLGFLVCETIERCLKGGK